MYRRLGSVLVAGVVTASAWLAVPSHVAASTIYEVSFPAAAEGEYELIALADMSSSLGSCTPSGTGINYPGADTWPAASNLTLYRTNFGSFFGRAWPDPGPYGCRMHASTAVTTWAYRFDPTEGTSYEFYFVWLKNAGSYCTPNIYWVGNSGTVIGTSLGTIAASDCSNDGGTEWSGPVTSDAPAGAVGVAWSTVEAATFIQHMEVSGLVVPEGGSDCGGVGELAAGAGITEADWGIYWSPSAERCLSGTGGTVSQDLVVSLAGAESVKFSSSFCTDGNYRSIWVYFLVTGGTEYIGSMRTNRPCSMGDAFPSVSAAVPAGAYGVKVVMERWIYQSDHTLELFGEGDGGGFGGGGSGDGFGGIGDSCEVPDGGWLDTDWLGYIGCVIVNGFAGLPSVLANAIWTVLGAPIYSALTGMLSVVQGTLDAVLGVPEMLFNMFITGPLAGLATYLSSWIGVPGAILDYFEDWLTWATALPSAIAEAFGTTLGDVLEFLFVPTAATGEAFEEFLASADDRAPVGWIVEVVSYLNGMLTAGNLAGPGLALSFPIMGATVSYDPAPITEAFAPYRPVGVAVVYLTLAMAAWRSIGRGLAT